MGLGINRRESSLISPNVIRSAEHPFQSLSAVPAPHTLRSKGFSSAFTKSGQLAPCFFILPKKEKNKSPLHMHPLCLRRHGFGVPLPTLFAHACHGRGCFLQTPAFTAANTQLFLFAWLREGKNPTRRRSICIENCFGWWDQRSGVPGEAGERVVHQFIACITRRHPPSRHPPGPNQKLK